MKPAARRPQAGVLLNAVNDGLSHSPEKSTGMDEDLYKLGYSGAGSCNPEIDKVPFKVVAIAAKIEFE